jgi:hypothetical protein
MVAIAPLGQISRRLDASYRGLNQRGEIASRPDSASTVTFRASAAVGATKATHYFLLSDPLSNRLAQDAALPR